MKLKKFNLVPRAGVGPIKLGESRSVIESVFSQSGIKKSATNNNSDYYIENTIQVEFDKNGFSWFIGVSHHSSYDVFYQNTNVFDITAKTLFDLVASNDDSGSHEFSEYEYIFPNQILTLWDADEQYDRKDGEQRIIWAQVGLGTSEYLRAIGAYS